MAKYFVKVSFHATLNTQQVAKTFITTQTATYPFTTYIEVVSDHQWANKNRDVNAMEGEIMIRC